MLSLKDAGDAATTPKRRRPRAAIACDSCRTRKVKCDGQFPCVACIHAGFSCLYKTRHTVAASTLSGTTAGTPSGDNVDASIASSEGSVRPLRPRLTPPRAPRVILPSPAPADAMSTSTLSTLTASTTTSTTAAPMTLSAPVHSPVHSPDEVEGPEGLGDINQHTDGAEFYGRTGTFYFLSQLQSRARDPRRMSQQQPLPPPPPPAVDVQPPTRGASTVGTPGDASVVNLLHSSDYPPSSAASSPSNVAAAAAAASSAARTELQRECARLYFTNLHCIHPVLDQVAFLARCERDVWDKDKDGAGAGAVHGGGGADTSGVRRRAQTRFLALFNIVLAVGAITAEDATLVMWKGATDFLDQAFAPAENRRRQPMGPGSHPGTGSMHTYLPIKAAHVFFEQAKFHLGDTFESSSFETAQTLFLMSVFCQNALKPHSCYMYAGMAVRTAFAIGIPTSLHSATSLESRFWWALYSFEIEMCSSAGRQSFLREPDHYRIPMPNLSTAPGPSTYMVNCMVDLADVLMAISANAARLDEPATWAQRSARAFVLDDRLAAWKAQLPNLFDLDRAALDEAELITKQKIVLKLRFLNARILLHRTFLLSSSVDTHRAQYAAHTRACVEAARDTIRFVYTTYLYRPYFRTWWYNCTYVLDATMVLLYVILADADAATAARLIEDIEKSLEIFSSMRRIAVARRCTEITKEVLTIARSHRDRPGLAAAALTGTGRMGAAGGLGPWSSPGSQATSGEGGGGGGGCSAEGPGPPGELSLLGYGAALGGMLGGALGDMADADIALLQGDPFAGLVDPGLVFDFLNFEDWAAWADREMGLEGSQ